MFKFFWRDKEVKEELLRRTGVVAQNALDYMLIRYLTYAPVDTGYMISTAEIVTEPKGSRFHGYLIVRASYAQWVEFGHFSVAGNWVSPQPSLAMALQDTAGKFPQLAAQARSRGFGTQSPVVAGFTK